jgi:hypothetical protein
LSHDWQITLICEGLAVGFTGSGVATGLLTGVAFATATSPTGTSINVWQPGQRAFFPAAESATCKTFWQE